MKRKGTKYLSLLLILLLALGTMGCGAGETQDEGTTFTMAITEEIDTLNPLSAWMQVSYEALLLLYDPLVRYDENLDPGPCLAKSWEISEDELTWTFNLMEDVLWHDGEPFTSADVKFTYELYQEYDSYMYGGYLTGISSIDCPDDYTVVITTEEPKANMLMNTSPIVPMHIWADQEDPYNWENPEPIGTGPYMYGGQGEGFVKFTKNDNYFLGTPKIANIVMVVYENYDTAAQALMIGEIDAAASLSAAQITQLEKDTNVEVLMAEVPGFCMMAINMMPATEDTQGDPLLRDKVIRQALDYCTDKQNIVDMAYGGAGIVGSTLINPGDPYHYSPPASDLRNYDIEKAKALLENAGYQDRNGDGIREDKAGNKLSFELISIAENVEEVKTAQIIAASCKEAGINLDLVTMDSGAVNDLIYAGQYDLYIWGWGSDVDPSVILKLFLTEEYFNFNETGFSNPRYDDLFYAQMHEMDEAERIAMVQEMQKMLYEDSPYIITLYDSYVQAIRSDRWTGYQQIPASTGGLFYNLTYNNFMNMEPVS
ncbi:MAG: ABC transporter substrate-binding protein [Anaerovoracaceae bacterium]|jgi:peptide/nickel transport system substrate-binding protein|nr:ABC transporter substrate-binding protein [Anaerovoracaceae bacterium]